MSGHSHWATTHRQKGVNDAKRAAVFTKYGRLITIAAREIKKVFVYLLNNHVKEDWKKSH